MQRIALPLRILSDSGEALQVAAMADVAVDLRDPGARGIHMSRLYLHLQEAFGNETVTATGLRRVLQDCIDSQDGLSTRARLALRYQHLLLRPALASGHAGWRAYPVAIQASLCAGRMTLELVFTVEYSSTCPASAALSRQLNADRFAADFAVARPLSGNVVRDWIASERGLAATPHAQRSRAEVRVELRESTPGAIQADATGSTADTLPLTALIDVVEAALGTPVQTAVKREDEQAFAQANAANLMFCEDAARRIAAALSQDARIASFDVEVAHLESLHAHDAVARVTGTGSQ